MAVSLTHYSQDITRRRAASVNSQNMPYHQGGTSYMPMPENFHPFSPPPPPPHYGPYGYQASAPPQQYQSQRLSYPLGPQRTYATRYEQPPPPPPRPPKTPIEPVSSNTSSNSSQNPPSNTPIIQPDPLPPHSNPQALTQTQSRAFENSSSIPPVRLGKDEVWSSQSGYTLFIITRETAHMPSFLSTKPLVTVTRTENGIPMGTIRFHTMLTSDIDLTLNGRNQTSISHSGCFHSRWGFESTTVQGETWYWMKDKLTGGAKLEDSKKKGRTLAKMKGDLLTFENAGKLNSASHDEILLSAIAMAEAARRAGGKGKEITDLAVAIGDFASGVGAATSDGGGGGGGGA